MVYLIHIEPGVAHARHYIGWTNADPASRIEEHKAGRGARLLAVAVERGSRLTLVRVWRGTRGDERRLKRWKRAPSLCPICAASPGGVHFMPSAEGVKESADES